MSDYETAEHARAQLLAAAAVMLPATRADLSLVDEERWGRVAELRHRDCRSIMRRTGETYYCILGACPGRWRAEDVDAMDERTFAALFAVAPVVRSEDVPVYCTEVVGDRREGYTRLRLQTADEAAAYFRRALVEARPRWRTHG